MTEAASNRGGSPAAKLLCLRAAEAAWNLSASHCNTDCKTYHKIRPLLRCLGLTAEPADQAAFFNSSMTEALHLGARDILVCGTSDTAMPELILAIADAASVPVRLHIVDVCQTPGELAGRCIQPEPSSLRTETSDILCWAPADQFDVIVTHSLLGQFSPETRPALFAKWHQLLRPDGRVITVNRIKTFGEVRSYDNATAEALAHEVVKKYKDGKLNTNIAPEELHGAVMDYCENRASFAVSSTKQIMDLCTGAGLEILTLDAQKGKSRSAGLRGPALPDGATYCHLVARKPKNLQGH